MNNSFLIRMSAILAALPLVALTSGAAAGRSPRPLGAGEQPLSAGVHVLDLVSREQGRKGYAHLPRIAVTLPSGWFNYNGWAVNDGGPLGLAFWDVSKVYPTGCRWQGKPLIDPGRTVGGLTRTLERRPLRHATRPRKAALGGFRGIYLRWSVPRKSDFSRCGQGYFESWTGRGWSTDRWQQGPGQVDRLWILDVNGKRLVVDANYMPSATRKQRTELDRIVHSMMFLPASPPRSSAPSAGLSKGAGHRDTWDETRSGVVHAYFMVRATHSHERQAALLKVRTSAAKLRLGCQLRLAGRRRSAYWHYQASPHEHIVVFSTPFPLRPTPAQPSAARPPASKPCGRAWGPHSISTRRAAIPGSSSVVRTLAPGTGGAGLSRRRSVPLCPGPGQPDERPLRRSAAGGRDRPRVQSPEALVALRACLGVAAALIMNGHPLRNHDCLPPKSEARLSAPAWAPRPAAESSGF